MISLLSNQTASHWNPINVFSKWCFPCSHSMADTCVETNRMASPINSSAIPSSACRNSPSLVPSAQATTTAPIVWITTTTQEDYARTAATSRTSHQPATLRHTSSHTVPPTLWGTYLPIHLLSIWQYLTITFLATHIKLIQAYSNKFRHIQATSSIFRHIRAYSFIFTTAVLHIISLSINCWRVFYS